MRRTTLLLLAALAGLAACDAPTDPVALATDDVAAAVAHDVGFFTREEFHAIPGTTHLVCDPVIFNAGPPREYSSRGITSHLGRSRAVLTFDACTIDLTGATWFSATGHAVHTAANGDELWSTWSLTQYENGHFTLDAVDFVGGTGRFAGYTGRAAGRGWISRETFAGWWVADGTLSKPGATR